MSARVRPGGVDPAGDLALWPLREGLRRRLIALDYEGFARACCLLLEAMGYGDARLSGRRAWKGYNRPGGGGWDVEAVLPGGLGTRRVIAQLKQFDGQPVHQRQVDELRGACIRAGASEALLITTSAFSRPVRRHSAAVGVIVALPGSLPMVAPVRLIDGEELTALMVSHRIGVQETGEVGDRRLALDGAFFDGLSDNPPERVPENRAACPSAGLPRSRRSWLMAEPPSAGATPIELTSTETTAPGAPAAGSPRRWLVTVRIRWGGRRGGR